MTGGSNPDRFVLRSSTYACFLLATTAVPHVQPATDVFAKAISSFPFKWVSPSMLNVSDVESAKQLLKLVSDVSWKVVDVMASPASPATNRSLDEHEAVLPSFRWLQTSPLTLAIWTPPHHPPLPLKVRVRKCRATIPECLWNAAAAPI